MCFGLCNAPATFQPATQYVLSGLLWEKLYVTLMMLFRWVRILNPHSFSPNVFIDSRSMICKWKQRSVSYSRNGLNILATWWVTKESLWDLSMIRSSSIGQFLPLNRSFNRSWDLWIIIVNTLKIMLSWFSRCNSLLMSWNRVIKYWPVPITKQELQSYLGFANYHCKYNKNYALLVQALQQLVNESKLGPIQLDSTIWMWSKVFETSYAMHQFFHTLTQITHSFLIVMPAKLQLAGTCFNLLMVQKRLLRSVAMLCLLHSIDIVLLKRSCWLFVQTVIVLHGLWVLRISKDNQLGGWRNWHNLICQSSIGLVNYVNADALSRIPDTLNYCVNYKAGVLLSCLPCFNEVSVNLLWKVLRFDITGSWGISSFFRMEYFSINGKMFWSHVCYQWCHLASEKKFFTWIMIPEILGIWVS